MKPSLRLACAAAFLALPPAHAAEPGPSNHDDPASHPYLGLWVTADGHIRHER